MCVYLYILFLSYKLWCSFAVVMDQSVSLFASKEGKKNDDVLNTGSEVTAPPCRTSRGRPRTAADLLPTRETDEVAFADLRPLRSTGVERSNCPLSPDGEYYKIYFLQQPATTLQHLTSEQVRCRILGVCTAASLANAVQAG